MPLPTIMLCTKLTSRGRSSHYLPDPLVLDADPRLHTGDCSTGRADNPNMKQALTVRDAHVPGIIPWALQMRSISREDPERVVRSVTGAILGCGGWVLSRSASDEGLIDILFEFERQSCLEIYSILIAAGVELSQSAHIRFTELCQCTRLVRKDCSEEIVSIDLEIQTFAMNEGKDLASPAPH
jgi:hypothetical protein